MALRESDHVSGCFSDSAMRPLSKSGPTDRPWSVTTSFTSDPEDVMRYLCLIYDDEKKVATMSEKDSNAFMGEYFAFTDGIKQSGHYLAGEALQPVETATTVRVRNGKVGTTDGPFAETKEQLGGFYMIEARDLNDAIQVASKIPSARIGSVEIRPIVEFSKP